MKLCNLCGDFSNECTCHLSDASIWRSLAQLPLPAQWAIITVGYVLLALGLSVAIMHEAGAQTAPRNAAQLSWTNAATNTDGTTIPTSCAAGVTQCAKLINTRVEYGSCSSAGVFGTKVGQIDVAAPGSTATVSNLVVQTYCFRSISVNDYSVESAASNVLSKTIAPPTPGAPLLAISSVAYEIRANSRGVLVADRIGLIPMGTTCNAQAITVGNIEYHLVPRGTLDVVNWPHDLDLVEVWAECG